MKKQKKTTTSKFKSRREYAADKGISLQRVGQLVKTGDIILTPNGQIDVAASEAMVREKQSALHAGKEAYAAWLKERTKGERLNNRLLEAKCEESEKRAQEKGETVAAACLAVVRNRLLGLGAQLAPQLAAMGGDPWRIQQLLQERHEEVLTESANFNTRKGLELMERMKQYDPTLPAYLRSIGLPIDDSPEDWPDGQKAKHLRQQVDAALPLASEVKQVLHKVASAIAPPTKPPNGTT